MSYIGRFAPSPTGPLHQGSLLAALASYLDARAHGGRWLLRIEDVDELRTVDGAERAICASLEAHGLHWDGEVTRQTGPQAQQRYQQALAQLDALGQTFYCDCTRKRLKAIDGPYPGYCRDRRQAQYRAATAGQPASHAIRLRCEAMSVAFEDRLLGTQHFALEALGDVVLRRRDGLYAYQLAVVVDDAAQGITDVVRGADLLDSTPWQLQLQRLLALPHPRWAHLPLLLEPGRGAKLSKQTGARPLDDSAAQHNLRTALAQLGQEQPEKDCSINDLLQFSSQNWRPEAIPRKPQLAI